jgi:23S rRNA (guanine745-N1)-methyltransferase
MIEAIADLLACPVCHADLTLDGRTFACPQNHTFDLNRAGFIDLVAPVGKKAPDGDTADMVRARWAFLTAGHYAPIADALSRALAAIHAERRIDALADLGSGPGFYLQQMLARVPIGRGIAVDVSRDAVAHAARLDARLGAVRANVKTLVPIRSGVLDALVVVFSPRNPAEWHRTLRAGGRALVVTPTERHLQQLRASGAVIGIEQGKQARLLAEVAPFFDLESTTPVEWDFVPTAFELETLIGMGPSAFHRDRLAVDPDAAPGAATEAAPPGPVTASVELRVLRAR